MDNETVIVLLLSGPVVIGSMEREWKGQNGRGVPELYVEWKPGVSWGTYDGGLRDGGDSWSSSVGSGSEKTLGHLSRWRVLDILSA